MLDPESYQLKEDKVYGVYIGSSFYAVKFVKIVRIGNQTFFHFTVEEEGFAFRKPMYLQMRYVYEIIEFNSFAEYKEHYESAKEEEKVNKFKNG